MIIKQFEYAPLAHYSYAIVSDGEMAVIDPERDPMQYYEFAHDHGARIVAVIETHPHADFISSHLQIHEETGATIYNSEKLGADYPHVTFDEGDTISMGQVTLSAINTPGHSPDSITIVARNGRKTALFTGDTLFIGDVGRPDLREKAGNMKAKRQELAEMMYYTIQNKFNELPDDALVFPAHGAGSLCGKNLSSDKSSTLGNERMGNWAFKKQAKEDFVNYLLDSQPFIPSYFGFNVDINKTGAKNSRNANAAVKFRFKAFEKGLLVDTRDASDFKKGHLPGSINIQANSSNDKFETWLGSIVEPEEVFNVIIENPYELEGILDRVSKIGYEGQLKSVLTLDKHRLEKSSILDLSDFKKNPSHYTIVDIRNQSEIDDGKFFRQALPHPLNNLRNTYQNIPKDKPIVVHCAGGYRSAAGSSLLSKLMNDVTVLDLGENINDFK
ncbi:MBL fold metallo-hydrolase [Maribacter algicola]|uniref:MBL fold metallo-hydrolase n=1 Tax=Maribacter algicola TaxID=2498892 RepID=A0A3R8R5K1_9FLAO|nr:MBL fold metallo-hydrolase [Maribacter algicola]RRQ50458.1 MBL fold metallo-hydrolase [Maribacter algicola]